MRLLVLAVLLAACSAPAPPPEDDCPFDPSKTAAGVCGCGIPDDDQDADGIADCTDPCPAHAGEFGLCGCGASLEDRDGDGVADCADACPDDAARAEPGECGCGAPVGDRDGDGRPDCADPCPDAVDCAFCAVDADCGGGPWCAPRRCEDAVCVVKPVPGTCWTGDSCLGDHERVDTCTRCDATTGAVVSDPTQPLAAAAGPVRQPANTEGIRHFGRGFGRPVVLTSDPALDVVNVASDHFTATAGSEPARGWFLALEEGVQEVGTIRLEARRVDGAPQTWQRVEFEHPWPSPPHLLTSHRHLQTRNLTRTGVEASWAGPPRPGGLVAVSPGAATLRVDDGSTTQTVSLRSGRTTGRGSEDCASIWQDDDSPWRDAPALFLGGEAQACPGAPDRLDARLGSEAVDWLAITAPFVADSVCTGAPTPDTLRLWAAGCPHVGSDARKTGRESLGDPLLDAAGRSPDSPGFDWDALFLLGDLTGFGPEHPAGAIEDIAFPPPEEGVRLHEQIARAAPEHPRGDLFMLIGNHDAASPRPQGVQHRRQAEWWFRHWVDPLGVESTNTHPSYQPPAERRFPIVAGRYDRYAVDLGNVRVLMLSDDNSGDRYAGGRGETRDRGRVDGELCLDPTTGLGGGNGVDDDGDGAVDEGCVQVPRTNGHPAGKLSEDAFAWLENQLIAAQGTERVLIAGHHYMLQDTTTASGVGEGFLRRPLEPGYHASHLEPAERGVRQELVSPHLRRFLRFLDRRGGGFIDFVGDRQGTGDRLTALLERHAGPLALWLGAHTHLRHPLDPGPPGASPKAPILEASTAHGGTSFLNAAPLTESHGNHGQGAMSRLLVFEEGRRDVQVRTYPHSDRIATREHDPDELATSGWYPAADATLPLPRPWLPPDD